jgi:hypothetical protein
VLGVFHKKTFLRYGEKGFLYVHIHLYIITISPLIVDQKKHDEYENSINALRIHFFIFMAAKIRQEFETSNSLEEINVIFIQFVRNPVYIMRENQISLLNEQFQLKCVI